VHLIPIPAIGAFISSTMYCCHSSRDVIPVEAHDLFPISLDNCCVVADGTRGAWEFSHRSADGGWHCIDQRGGRLEDFVFLDLEAILEFIDISTLPKSMTEAAYAFMEGVLLHYHGGEIPVIEIENDPTAPGIHRVHFRQQSIGYHDPWARPDHAETPF